MYVGAPDLLSEGACGWRRWGDVGEGAGAGAAEAERGEIRERDGEERRCGGPAASDHSPLSGSLRLAPAALLLHPCPAMPASSHPEPAPAMALPPARARIVIMMMVVMEMVLAAQAERRQHLRAGECYVGLPSLCEPCLPPPTSRRRRRRRRPARAAIACPATLARCDRQVITLGCWLWFQAAPAVCKATVFSPPRSTHPLLSSSSSSPSST